MRKEAQRWLRQADADLEAARISLTGGRYEWACFQAQQAAEKALKAFLYDRGCTSAMTHSLEELIKLSADLEAELARVNKEAHFLDMFYVPTRDPNTLAGTQAPTDYYNLEDASKCVSSAESILNAVKSTIAG